MPHAEQAERWARLDRTKHAGPDERFADLDRIARDLVHTRCRVTRATLRECSHASSESSSNPSHEQCRHGPSSPVSGSVCSVQSCLHSQVYDMIIDSTG